MRGWVGRHEMRLGYFRLRLGFGFQERLVYQTLDTISFMYTHLPCSHDQCIMHAIYTLFTVFGYHILLGHHTPAR